MKWGSSLNFVHAHGNFANLELQKLFNKNNYPLVQIHCIIKIMCQDLPLGCLNCLFGVCCEKIETFAVVFEFLYFTGTCKNSEIFTQYCYANFLFCPNFQNFWSYRSMVNVQITTDCSVFDRFCF